MVARSEQLYNRAKKILPGGVDSPVRYFEPYPFFAASARGSKLVTADHKTLTVHLRARSGGRQDRAAIRVTLRR